MPGPLSLNIRSIRVKWGYKQDDFGEIFNLNRGNISSYETGTAEPRIGFLSKLFELSGIPIQNLLTREISDEEIPLRPGAFTPEEPFVVNDPPGMYKQHDPAMAKHHLMNLYNLVGEVDNLRWEVQKLKIEMDKLKQKE